MAIGVKKSSRKYINKNGKIEKKHIISKMKNREFKYTLALVLVFMVVFAVIGYNTLQFDNGALLNDIKSADDSSNVSSTSQIFTLTNENIMSDKEGLLSYAYQINLENKTSDTVDYQLVLEKDEDMIKLCDCDNRQFSLNQIRYSLNDGSANSLDDGMVIKEISLDAGESEKVSLKLWVSDTVNSNNGDFHFHGHFVLNEITE